MIMELLHFIGICPDSLGHLDLLEIIVNMYNINITDSIKILINKFRI